MAYNESAHSRYNWRGTAWANFVIALVLLVSVFNAVLVIGFQRMSVYTYATQEEVLAQQEPYTLLDRVEYTSPWGMENYLYSHLIQTDAGQTWLITLEKHFLLGRYHLVSQEEIDSASYETVLHADSEDRAVQVLNRQQIVPGDRSSRMFSMMAGLNIPFKVCLWVAGLFAIEIILTVVVLRLRRG